MNSVWAVRKQQRCDAKEKFDAVTGTFLLQAHDFE
jgi:hypothetical protein